MLELLIFPTLFWASVAVSLTIAVIVLTRWKVLVAQELAGLYLAAATIAIGMAPFQVGFSLNNIDAGGLLALQSMMIPIILFVGRVPAR